MVGAVLPGSHHIDDVLQEAFTRVLRSNRRFSSPNDAYKYLRTSTLTTAIDFYRRLKRQHRVFAACDVKSIYRPTSGHDDPLSRLIRVEEVNERNALMAEVYAAVENLAPEQQEAIRAFFGKRRQASLKEYCMDAGVSYSTLRCRMLKGIDRIREQLQERNINGFGAEEESEP